MLESYSRFSDSTPREPHECVAKDQPRSQPSHKRTLLACPVPDLHFSNTLSASIRAPKRLRDSLCLVRGIYKAQLITMHPMCCSYQMSRSTCTRQFTLCLTLLLLDYHSVALPQEIVGREYSHESHFPATGLRSVAIADMYSDAPGGSSSQRQRDSRREWSIGHPMLAIDNASLTRHYRPCDLSITNPRRSPERLSEHFPTRPEPGLACRSHEAVSAISPYLRSYRHSYC